MSADLAFGDWLRRRRRALDLTQADLADRVGCSAATIQKIEREERRPSRQLAELLARTLQIPPEQHAAFLKTARGDRLASRLASIAPPDGGPRLPVPQTSLVGREPELAGLSRLLQDAQCRLLTLTGPGGVGKTRLALQAAVQQQAYFADGAAFVSLTPLAGREQIVTAIADALGFVLYGATDRATQLFHYLRAKGLLLVLDNFEHLLADAASVALVSDLLDASPGAKLLVTSREPLQLQPEWVFVVQGLPIREEPEAGDAGADSAVRLFLQRARQARTDLALTAADHAAILQICRLVEGLPLGIELAAAWVRTLTCPEIAREIQRSADFLAGSARDLPKRHRSLRAVFEHSWNLLAPEEQRALRRLAVFRGGFTRAGAQEVGGANLPLLSSLVSKSLLRRLAGGRYDLHEMVRQYALGHLQEDAGERAEAEARHSRFFASLLEARGPGIKGAEREAVVAELLPELANVRQAWDWAAAGGQAAELSRAADTLFWLYESRCNCREGVPIFGQAVGSLAGEEADAARRTALGQALNYEGFFLYRQGHAAQGKELLARSLDLLGPLAAAEAAPARAALSDTYAFLGTVTFEMGDYAEGLRLLREGLARKRALDDRWGAAFCLRQLGLAAYRLGDFAEARRLLSESLTLGRAMGNTWATAAALTLLGAAAHAQGAHAEAQALLREGLALSESIEDRFNAAYALNSLGLVAHALGRHGEALDLIGDSADLSAGIGDLASLAQTVNGLGNVKLDLGELAEARRCFREALQAALEAQVTPVALDSLAGLAVLLAREAQAEPAVELASLVLGHPASTRAALARAEHLHAELAAQLPPAQIEAARARTQGATLEATAQRLLRAQA